MAAAPTEVTGHSPRLAREGRQLKCQFALWRLGVVLASLALAGLDYAAHGLHPTLRAFLDSAEFRGLLGVVIVCVLLWGLRRSGVKQFPHEGPQEAAPDPSPQEAPEPSPGADRDDGRDTIICCSGGGIKSASFCLGALRVLDDRGYFARTSTIVAVSGGGYAASAYLAMYKHLDTRGRMPRAGTPFAPESRELTVLRRRTNYIGSPGRARFDLATSLLFGIAVNTVLIGAAMAGLAWVMAQHVALTRLVDTTVRPGSSLWTMVWLGWPHWWRYVTGPLLLLTIAVLIFCGRRIRSTLLADPDKNDFRRIVLRAWNAVIDGARIAYCRLASLDGSEDGSEDCTEDGRRILFLNQTPNRLLRVALFLGAVSVGLPWVAVQLHNVMIDGKVGGITPPIQAATGAATLAALVSFVRSLAKGITTPVGADTATGRVLEVFRRRLAPALAVTLFALILFAATAALTAVYMTEASRHTLGPIPLVFAVVSPIVVWTLGLTNLTTIHPYYRERLSYAFLEHSGASGLRLADLQPPRENRSDGSGAANSAELSAAAMGSPPVPDAAPRVDVTANHATPAAEGASAKSVDKTNERETYEHPLASSTRRGRRTRQMRCEIPDTEPLKEPPPKRPALVLMATANIADGDVLPTGRGGTPFILGSAAVGLTERTLPGGRSLVRTDQYCIDPVGGRAGDLELSTAMAISGAAFAPRAGRESKLHGAYRLLLAFANLRLGVWMPNTYYPTSRQGSLVRRWSWRVNQQMDRPTSLAVFAEAFGGMPVSAPYLYLTDGGHYDNLGLVESLRRRPKRLLVLDGSGDPEDQFPVVGDAIATLRMDHDIEVQFDPTRLLRGDDTYARTGHVRAVATYPDDSTCEITYIKCVLLEGLPWDLEAYRRRNPDFPATTQRFEMFDEFDFEAYRKLGESLVDRAFAAGGLR